MLFMGFQTTGDRCRKRFNTVVARTPFAMLKARSFLTQWVVLSLLFPVMVTCFMLSAHAEGLSLLPTDGDKSTSSARHELEERSLTVDKLRVNYVETGQGPNVVLIHGNAGGLDDFEFGAIDLLSQNYRVIAFDRPGHGSSERPSGREATVEYQADLLHQTLSQLGVSHPILVGHSWGSALALAFALRFPGEASALVLLAPAAYPDNEANGLLRTLIKTPLVGDAALFLGKSLIGGSVLKKDLERAFSPQQVPREYLKAAASSWLGRKQLKAYLEDEWALNSSLRKMSKHYNEIDMPVVIVTGDQDQIVSPQENAQRLQAVIPNAKMLQLENTGHEIPQTRPDSVYAAISMISEPSGKQVGTVASGL
jgi:pimeloyl-ACP methyl ester carboxylesterase